MIKLEKITMEMFDDCIRLDAGEAADKFVAPNEISLAQAYVALTNNDCTPMPYGIYEDDQMIGFLMMAYFSIEQNDDHEAIYEIWRFMIDEKYQGKGYGKESMKIAFELLKTKPLGDASKIFLSFVPGNDKASKLYKDLGFYETGTFDHGEIVMCYDL